MPSSRRFNDPTTEVLYKSIKFVGESLLIFALGGLFKDLRLSFFISWSWPLNFHIRVYISDKWLRLGPVKVNSITAIIVGAETREISLVIPFYLAACLPFMLGRIN